MRNLGKIITIVILLIFFTALSTAEITSVKIRSDGRNVILFEKFGFTNTGHVSIAISSVSITSIPVTSNISQPVPSRLGFFLLSKKARSQVNINFPNPKLCFLDSKFITLLFTFRDLSPPPRSSFNKSYNVTYPNLYTLYFANCNPLSYVTMDVRTVLYNIDGNTKDYLSVGLTKLPSLYYIFTIIYFCFLMFCILVSFKNRTYTHLIHFLMGVFLVMKELNLLSAFEAQRNVKDIGSPHVWDIVFYIIDFIRVVILYTAIALTKTTMVLITVIPLQVVTTAFVILKGETGGPFTNEWVTLNMVLLLVESLCCFVVILPMLCSECISRTNRDANRSAINFYEKLYIVALYYLVAGCVHFWGVVMDSTDSCKYHWGSIAAVEITSLLFYMVLFYKLRPSEKNEYFFRHNLDRVPVAVGREVGV